MRPLIVLAVVVLAVNAQDECMPPKPGEKHAHPPECCKVESVGGIIPAAMKNGVAKCQEKYPRPPRPTGPPPTGTPPAPTPEMKKHRACMSECAFTEAGFIKDGKPDKAAIVKGFANNNKEVAAAVSAALEKCFSSYEKDIDTSLECMSGAAELEKCVTREVFLNCPTSLWTDSTECTTLKTKVTKCPDFPMMGGPHHGPRPN